MLDLKSVKQFLPAAFASYRAMSASRSSSAAFARSPSATPMLAVSDSCLTICPSIS